MSLSATVDRLALVEALRICGAAAKPSQTLPIVSHVLIQSDGEALSFRTTDLDLTIITSCVAKIEANGSATVEHKQIAALVKAFSGDEVQLIRDDRDRLRVTSGTSSYELPSFAAADFPDIAEYDDADPIEIGAKDLVAAMETCAFAVDSRDFGRAHFLGGVWLHANGTGTVFDASDGKRIVRMRMHSRGKSEPLLIPLDGMRAVAALTPLDDEVAKVSAPDRFVVIEFSAVKFLVRSADRVAPPPLDEEFAKAQRGAIWLTTDRAELSAAFTRAAMFGDTPNKNVTGLLNVDLEPGKITVFSMRPDRSAHEELGADSKVSAKFGCQARHVAEFLDAIECDRIAFGVTDGKTPVLMRDAQAIGDATPEVEYMFALVGR